MPTRYHPVQEAAQLGHEAAATVLAVFESERLVPAFVDQYVRRHNRRELKISPLRYRELLVTLTRESLVAVAAHMQAEVPRWLAPKGRDARKQEAAETAEAADAFLQALAGTVATALRWTPGDVAEFAGDVALYLRMAAFAAPAVAPLPTAPARRSAAGTRSSLRVGSRAPARAAGPFADRCAMLLDPSLMEKARAAASELHSELQKIASRALTTALKTK